MRSRGQEAAAARPPPESFWLVDPLDGTKEFLDGTDDFTVNIALVEARAPVLGIVLAPVRGLLFRRARTGAER
jgi:3'(2'), 5'-bisphosphate nucleotidase